MFHLFRTILGSPLLATDESEDNPPSNSPSTEESNPTRESDPLTRVFFMGGNGHSEGRLAPARATLAAKKTPLEVISVPYPGFEGRPGPDSFDAFAGTIGAWFSEANLRPSDVIYATGIGGLIALELRSQGYLMEQRLILQAPVLWGLRDRWFPRIMRISRLLPKALQSAFKLGPMQRHFIAKHFEQAISPELQSEFFDGYARCSIFAQFFRWLTPAFLDRLRVDLRRRPVSLESIEFWWGDSDTVVTIDELRVTERILEREFPVKTFPGWHHYPMIDRPEEWTEALRDELAPSL